MIFFYSVFLCLTGIRAPGWRRRGALGRLLHKLSSTKQLCKTGARTWLIGNNCCFYRSTTVRAFVLVETNGFYLSGERKPTPQKTPCKGQAVGKGFCLLSLPIRCSWKPILFWWDFFSPFLLWLNVLCILLEMSIRYFFSSAIYLYSVRLCSLFVSWVN